MKDKIKKYWQHIAEQDKIELEKFFHKNAKIKWNNTNELFNVEEFIIANCEYPGKWKSEIQRIDNIDNIYITVVKIIETEENISFYVVSYIKFEEDKIIDIEEYWGDNGEPPQWRKDKNIGNKII